MTIIKMRAFLCGSPDIDVRLAWVLSGSGAREEPIPPLTYTIGWTQGDTAATWSGGRLRFERTGRASDDNFPGTSVAGSAAVRPRPVSLACSWMECSWLRWILFQRARKSGTDVRGRRPG